MNPKKFMLIVLLLTLLLVFTYDGYFNRDPVRIIPESGFLAPSDGIITAIDDTTITIFIGLQDVHVQRAPVGGTITTVSPYRSNDRDYVDIWIDSPDAGHFKVIQKSGAVAKTIQTFVSEGDTVERGDKLGRILMGSGCIVFVPGSYNITAHVGQYIKAGETVIAVRG